MEGIYIHIPFCRQACRYCDFYFTVSIQHQDEFVDALLVEIRQRALQYPDTELGSLYLGGGTPSVLSRENIDRIMDSVWRHYKISDHAEVTIECNPDDLDTSFLEYLRQSGFNRISIGIQSFSDESLSLMRRSHHASQAVRCVHDASDAGFDNITVDLIYGLPGQTPEGWKENVNRALSLPIQHLSAYHLTYEPGTVFDYWRKKERVVPVEEEQSIRMYRILRERLMESGFEHYEISNFAREGKRSRHNQLYWSGDPYLGFGPAAHSFDGNSRSWNVASLKEYMESVSSEKSFSESEALSVKERYHDYLITSLRTSDGADPEYILQQFGSEIRNHFDRKTGLFIADGSMILSKKQLVIDPDRWLVADHIMRTLFLNR
jgi:oxygen-independent coproporphyrinogen-3 oxidase